VLEIGEDELDVNDEGAGALESVPPALSNSKLPLAMSMMSRVQHRWGY